MQVCFKEGKYHSSSETETRKWFMVAAILFLKI